MQKLERQPMTFVVCGETGVGKTYRNLIEISRYIKGQLNGSKGRKVLAFDVNDDDYPQFRTVSLNAIQKLKSICARRVRPIKPNGQNMNIEEKRETVEQIISKFKNGLLVLDDLDKYLVGAKGQSVVGLLTTNRHNGLDIMIGHQSISKITTTEWESVSILRLHRQVDDITRYRNRIPNFFLVCIATFIVDEQYDLANQAFQENEITELEYKKRRSFFVYVDMRRLKIRGASKKAIIRATKKYIDLFESKKVKMMLQETDFDDNKKFKSRKDVVLVLIGQYLRCFEGGK